MKKETVLVTGSSSGFGEMISVELVRAGRRVFASMRSPDGSNAPKAHQYEALARAEGLALTPIELDVTNEDSVDTAALRVLADADAIVVVHNVGHTSFGPTEAFTPEQLVQLYEINAVGAHRVSRAVLPHMRHRGSGLLVWISSSSVRSAWSPYLGLYFAAKAALEQLATSYAAEVARFGVETAIVVPGAFTSGTRHFEHASGPGDDAIARCYDEGPNAGLGEAVLAADRRLEPEGADPAEVARAVRRVVETPPGRRPFRTTVDPSRDGSEIVAAVQDRLREEILGRVGLSDLLHPSGPGRDGN